MYVPSDYVSPPIFFSESFNSAFPQPEDDRSAPVPGGFSPRFSRTAMACPGMQRTDRPRPSLASASPTHFPSPSVYRPGYANLQTRRTRVFTSTPPTSLSSQIHSKLSAIDASAATSASVNRNHASHRLFRGGGAAPPIRPRQVPRSPAAVLRVLGVNAYLQSATQGLEVRAALPSRCYASLTVQPCPIDPCAAVAIPPCTHRRSVRRLLVRSLTTLGPTPSPARSLALRQDEGNQRQHRRLRKRVAYLPAPLGRARLHRTVRTGHPDPSLVVDAAGARARSLAERSYEAVYAGFGFKGVGLERVEELN
ncbi:hypothetical protein R3P38DRAFT_3216584 [Favolaschia claudopus]|uniref:Uncharacterized protein n=1 Tax=Favolaschia claudopus TaxID=2862362 RepID=A0AAW0A6D9_9AGAR